MDIAPSQTAELIKSQNIPNIKATNWVASPIKRSFLSFLRNMILTRLSPKLKTTSFTPRLQIRMDAFQFLTKLGYINKSKLLSVSFIWPDSSQICLRLSSLCEFCIKYWRSLSSFPAKRYYWKQQFLFVQMKLGANLELDGTINIIICSMSHWAGASGAKSFWQERAWLQIVISPIPTSIHFSVIGLSHGSQHDDMGGNTGCSCFLSALISAM